MTHGNIDLEFWVSSDMNSRVGLNRQSLARLILLGLSYTSILADRISKTSLTVEIETTFCLKPLTN